MSSESKGLLQITFSVTLFVKFILYGMILTKFSFWGPVSPKRIVTISLPFEF